MSEVFAAQRARSFLIAVGFFLAVQSSVPYAQDGTQSQGSHGPAPSVAEDNGRERGGNLDPPIHAELPSTRVETTPVQRVTADITGQTLVVKVERPKMPVRRRVASPGAKTVLRLVKMRQAIFSSDRGG